MANIENMHVPEQPDENPYRARLLQDAASLITGDRQKDYGPPEENFQRIADLWSVHLKKKLQYDVKITARDVAELMILLKVARMIESPTEDSYKDAAGYAAIGAELAEAERKMQIDTELKPTEETKQSWPPMAVRGGIRYPNSGVSAEKIWNEPDEGPGTRVQY